jgi:hypothetical protein
MADYSYDNTFCAVLELGNLLETLVLNPTMSAFQARWDWTHGVGSLPGPMPALQRVKTRVVGISNMGNWFQLQSLRCLKAFPQLRARGLLVCRTIDVVL